MDCAENFQSTYMIDFTATEHHTSKSQEDIVDFGYFSNAKEVLEILIEEERVR
jgi:hypothetical protein